MRLITIEAGRSELGLRGERMELGNYTMERMESVYGEIREGGMVIYKSEEKGIRVKGLFAVVGRIIEII